MSNYDELKFKDLKTSLLVNRITSNYDDLKF